MKIVYDSWLAEMFGYDVFAINITDPTDVHEYAMQGHLPSHNTNTPEAFYFTKVPTTKVEILGNLQRLDFRVVDTSITFAREPEQYAPQSGVEIVPVHPEHVDNILDIAETSFIYSRFHLDPLISKALANKIKREWIANYASGKRGESLFAALCDGTPMGFLAVIASTTAYEKPCKAIDLIGVGRQFQRRGIGRALVRFFVGRYLNEVDHLRVGTQVANIPSSRLYESCGFQLEESNYVLHRHTLNGVPLT
jgi:ribosomal protein S18 acetylase RimI-like enzyme